MSQPGEMSGNESVPGERGTPVVNSIRSMQSRVSSVLAAGLMIALGLGALSWYYTNALSRQKRMRQAAMTAATNNAQGEMTLPPLGAVEAAQSMAPGVPAEVATRRPSVSGPPAVVVAPDLPLEPSRMPPYTVTDPYHPPQGQAAGDRRLSGAAFARESAQSSPTAPAPAEGQEAGGIAIPVSQALTGQLPGQFASARGGDGLTTLLRPGVTTAARAQMLPTQQFLLPKGAFIDCTLETAIDSTLPGMTTCVTATDTFGVDGKVVLLERGSKLVGETRGEVQNGSARVFVLWTEARTPTGVLVPLDSPGTDELGRSGLPGEVNRHFWDRFGAALLISVVDGAIQAAAQSASRGNGAIIYNPSGSQEALTDVLKGTINISPTVIKHQGDRIQILVARDLDFRPVYELRAAGL
jgi:type IV secretion system protein VirB10